MTNRIDRWCGKCGATTAHYFRRGQSSGCVACALAQSRRWKRENRDKANEWSRRAYAKNPKAAYERQKRYVAKNPRYRVPWQLQKKYGMRLSEYEALAASQGGCCAICRQPCKLVVDHDHGTKTIRGLLCRKCNAGIGLLGDTYEAVLLALDYLTGVSSEKKASS